MRGMSTGLSRTLAAKAGAPEESPGLRSRCSGAGTRTSCSRTPGSTGRGERPGHQHTERPGHSGSGFGPILRERSVDLYLPEALMHLPDDVARRFDFNGRRIADLSLWWSYLTGWQISAGPGRTKAVHRWMGAGLIRARPGRIGPAVMLRPLVPT
ncbi:hypothetical protein, partial [Kitasatospora griseola]|uniref:hypothetical protein n=1 Tax=Kitasatospora griseola TaxID=2064 RepID=UPI0019882603